MLKKLLAIFAYTIFLLTVVIVSLELIARQLPTWESWINVIHNPDHRMTAFQEPHMNSDGIRSNIEADEFKEEDFNIIFLGDSFTYGVRLHQQKTVPQRFEQLARQRYPRMNINVANFGWIGSGPLLHYRQLKDIGRKYKPDLIIHLLDMTDVGDDLLYGAIINRKNMYGLGYYIPATTIMLHKIITEFLQWNALSMYLFGLPSEHYFIVENPLEETRWGFDHMKKNIDAINRYAKEELSAKYMVMVLPRYFQYNPEESPNNWEKDWYSIPGPYSMEPFKYFETMKQEVSYPLYSMLSDFQTTDVYPTVWDDDAHFCKEGAMFAAQVALKYCLKEDCFNENEINKH